MVHIRTRASSKIALVAIITATTALMLPNTPMALPLNEGRIEQMSDCGWPGDQACILEEQTKLNQLEQLKVFQKARDAEVASILASYKGTYDGYWIVDASSRRKEIGDTDVLASNSDTRSISITAIPLKPRIGTIAASVSFEVWRKTGWADTRNVAVATDNVYLGKARANRSYRFGRFSTDAIVFYSVGNVRKGGHLGVGCYPRPLSYTEALERGC